MDFVKAPILMGQQGAEVANLQDVILWLVQEGIYAPASPDDINLLAEEKIKQIFGAVTRKMLEEICTLLSAPTGYDVNEDVAAAINKAVTDALVLPEAYAVSGRVVNKNGKPLSGITVKVYAVTLHDREEIGAATTDNQGNYSVSYTIDAVITHITVPPLVPGSNVGLQVEAEVPELGAPVASAIYFRFTAAPVIEVIVPVDGTGSITDEFTSIDERVSASFGSGPTKPHLQEEDAPFIAGAIGENEELVRFYIFSRKHEEKTLIAAEAYYGVMRQTQKTALEALLNLSAIELKAALQYVIAMNIIPHADEATVDDYVSTLKSAMVNIVMDSATGEPEDSRAFALISQFLSSNTKVYQFFSYYYKDEKKDDTFWEEANITAAVTGITTEETENLKTAFAIALITGNNPLLVEYIVLSGYQEYVGMPVADWEDLIENEKDKPGFLYPDYITAIDEADRVAEYAASVKSKMDATFPELKLLNQVTGDTNEAFPNLSGSLLVFINDNPGFMLLRTPVSLLKAEDTPFNFEHIPSPGDFIEEVATVQRLSAIVPGYEAMAALQADGVTSARDITQLSQAAFAEAYASTLGSVANANLAYSNAMNIVMLSQVVSLGVYQALNHNVQVIFNEPAEANPEWRSLFGNVDFCTCDSCMSVFSPAAYFVDSLELLRRYNQPAYDQLKQKRPDLWNLLLTCKNTNTSLPYIDLVNELLEDLMHASGISIGSSPLSPYLRDHDTTLDTQTLRAVPQYIDNTGAGNPYLLLKGARYPWNAPYNYYNEQIKEHLDIIDLKPSRIPEVFEQIRSTLSFRNVEQACVYLGIINENAGDGDYYMLIDDDNSNLFTYYGVRDNHVINPQDRTPLLIPSGDPASVLKRVDVFLQQSGLTFKDLLELLDCYYINPVTTGTNRLLKIVGDPETACNTSAMTIEDADVSNLMAMHRFIRLQRRTGWSKYELDRVFTALNITSNAIFDDEVILAVATLKKLTDMLQCPVDVAIPLLGDIACLPYSSYDGDKPRLIPTQYERLFRNPAVVPGQLDPLTYPFPADMESWRDNTALPQAITQAQLNYVLGAVNMSEQDFDYLFAFFMADANLNSTFITPAASEKFAFTYRNVLHLLRECTLARLLQMTVREWCYMRSWFRINEIDPFAGSGAANVSGMLHLVAQVKQLRRVAINADTLAYAFDDRFINEADKKSKRTALFNNYKALCTLLGKLNSDVLADGSVDAKALLAKMEQLLSPPDAEFVVSYVAALGNMTDTPPYLFTNGERARLITLLPMELTDEKKELIADQLTGTPDTGDYTVTDIEERLALVNMIYTKAILKVQIRNFLSTSYKADLAVTESLLQSWIVPDINISAYDVLINEQYISSNGEPDMNEAWSISALQVIEKFAKAVIVQQAGKLSADEMAFFLKNRTMLTVPDFANLPAGNVWGITPVNHPAATATWINLLEWLDVKMTIAPSPTGLTDILLAVFGLNGTPSASAKKQAWFDAMMQALLINEADLTALVGNRSDAGSVGVLLFDFTSGDVHLRPYVYRQIFDCMDLRAELQVNMNSCVNIINAILSPQSQAAADHIVQAVKARFSNDEWLSHIQPVNDRLRTGRRDAMVAYLLAKPPLEYQKTWITADDIFDTLLLDTQMMPVVQTSRIKQAVSSVQLFVDRCLLQQEKNSLDELIQLTSDTIRQWNLWRKWYRIWEANRRIFVYPENWIEPDLRDDKSPFFTELEKFLKQNDITPENMENAYKTYLERLDQVSHLEVVGYYTEDILNGSVVSDTIVHVWGRTRSNPHIYFYRKRKMGIWSAWEKMETQVDGDQFVPVKWRGRLRLYWLSFTEQTKEKPATMLIGEENAYPYKSWKIELNWTEQKDGKWMPKQVGKEFLQTDWGDTFTAADIRFNYGNTYQWTPSFRPFTPNSFKDSFEYLKRSTVPYCRINDDGELEVIVHGRLKYITQPELNTYLDTQKVNAARLRSLIAAIPSSVDDNFPWPVYGSMQLKSRRQLKEDLCNEYQLNEYRSIAADFYSNNFHYEEFKGRFTVKHGKVYADRNNVPHTFYDALIEHYPYKPEDGSYVYERDAQLGYNHLLSNGSAPADSVQLLKRTPQFAGAPTPDKYLLFPKVAPTSNAGYIPFPKFFYKDYKNSFFVEKVMVPQKIGLGGSTSYFSNMIPSSLVSHTSLSVASGLSNQVASIGLLTAGTSNLSHVSGQALATSVPRYRFYSFYHYKINELLDRLDTTGLEGLFDWEFVHAHTTDTANDQVLFTDTYQPTAYVQQYLINQGNTLAYPTSLLGFDAADPNSIYNWELFFHIPMLVANKLMQDQKFSEAMQWYHYVFNPANKSGTDHGSGPERFWQFIPFYLQAGAGVPGIDEIMMNPDLATDVQRWANDPFKPHLVARTRIGAYMKNVLMKYLDNLVAWGDQLFRRDTMESINEATLLYIIAARLLGKAPVKIPARAGSNPHSYQDFADNPNNINAFSNALVAVETVLAPTGSSQTYTGNDLHMFYFCIPPNDKLLSYWDVVADRLFKIRNSQSIDGIERQLALFEPPIDPALLVRAAAAGVSMSDAVNEQFAPLPQYRFGVMIQKATELTQEVKSLGASLLSAIEKKDAEHISLLRSSQEIAILEAAQGIKEMQVQETQTQIAALQDQKGIVTTRRDHYQGLLDTGLNGQEQSQLDSLKLSIPLRSVQSSSLALSSILRLLPEFKIGAIPSIGATYGGANIAGGLESAASVAGIASTINDINGSMAGIKAGFARREQDWNLQLKLANGELKQLEKQLVAAQIRQAIAEKELGNHKILMQNTSDMDQAMRDKYSNEELYDWMISNISLTYFQCYKLAFDIAKKAERTYAYELGTEPTTPFIQFGYWDSLKKGLLAGEALLYDIKRMDTAYLDQNKRLHELTKHISLAALDPKALIDLREGKIAAIKLPEWLFDMDYPGHYMRRIKSVSLSIPCIAGPYTTVTAQLTLNSSKYRKNTLVPAATGGEDTYREFPENGDSMRFVYLRGGGQSIGTSNAQNDNGMFEFSFRDERYLPFEGAGAVSEWTLQLPSRYASFDRNSISDVIIHISYTAKYDGVLAKNANISLDTLLNDGANEVLPRLFNLKQEFPNEWNTYVKAVKAGDIDAEMAIPVTPERFPMFTKGKAISFRTLLLKAACSEDAGSMSVTFSWPVAGSDPAVQNLLLDADDYYGDDTAGSAISISQGYAGTMKIAGPDSAAGLAALLESIDMLWMAVMYKID